MCYDHNIRLYCCGWRAEVDVLGHDLSLRHDLVTPLRRVIYQGVLRHPQTFNVRAWLERKAARVFRGRSCTKRPCTPGKWSSQSATTTHKQGPFDMGSSNSRSCSIHCDNVISNWTWTWQKKGTFSLQQWPLSVLTQCPPGVSKDIWRH